MRCAIAALALAGLPSCIYDHPDPNCGKEGGVRVVYDWSMDATASPEGMSVLFYPVGEGFYWRYELGADGGSVELANGTYHVVTFNNDTGALLFENQDDFTKALVTTRPARLTDGFAQGYALSQPPRRAQEEAQPVVAQPDVAWGAAKARFAMTDTTRQLTLSPKPLVARYHVIIDGVANIESASQVAMSISGLAAGRMLRDADMIPVDVTVPGSMRRSGEKALSGWMLGFGRINDDHGRCLLSVYALLRDGSRKVYEYDVTSIVASAPNQSDVEIRLQGLEFPYIETSGGTGMEVGVDDWDVVEIELST